jgi:hypothetical protein
MVSAIFPFLFCNLYKYIRFSIALVSERVRPDIFFFRNSFKRSMLADCRTGISRGGGESDILIFTKYYLFYLFGNSY